MSCRSAQCDKQAPERLRLPSRKATFAHPQHSSDGRAGLILSSLGAPLQPFDLRLQACRHGRMSSGFCTGSATGAFWSVKCM